MQHLKWFLLVVFATVLVEGRYIRPAMEHKVSNLIDNFAKFKDDLKRGCRPRPGSAFCTGKRDILADTRNAIPPPPLNEVYAKSKRDDFVENGDTNKNKGKRVVMAFNPMSIDDFAKFKDENKKDCRPRPGSFFCTGKRETLDNKEMANTDELPNETILGKLSLENY